ncbi:hypothetical protein AAHZ94_07545 [Streptomyces sp. HSW2009]|uniref:hypothetical protein n=1 Tax=Streptomyces sp. HSW2009 TaxID=3142890 RepID=UPI0032EF52BF
MPRTTTTYDLCRRRRAPRPGAAAGYDTAYETAYETTYDATHNATYDGDGR